MCIYIYMYIYTYVYIYTISGISGRNPSQKVWSCFRASDFFWVKTRYDRLELEYITEKTSRLDPVVVQTATPPVRSSGKTSAIFHPFDTA